MVYCDFSNSLYKYLDIYHNGLKKLANKEMQAIVGHLREMSDKNQDEILTQFLSDYCDKPTLCNMKVWMKLLVKKKGPYPLWI